MADKDWRSGTLVGSGYALVVDGRAIITHTERSKLVELLDAAARKMGIASPVTDKHIKQVCIILPPWEGATDGR
jgi:hypothetical protein